MSKDVPQPKVKNTASLFLARIHGVDDIRCANCIAFHTDGHEWCKRHLNQPAYHWLCEDYIFNPQAPHE